MDDADAQLESFICKFDPDDQALIRNIPAAILRRSIGTPHFEQPVFGDFEIVRRAASACNRVRTRRLVDPILEHCRVDVNADRLANHKPLIQFETLLGLELNELGQTTFEMDRAAGDAIGSDERSWQCV